MASTLNVTKALQNPGQEYPFTADAQIEEMEMFGDPVRLVDVNAQGIFFGTGKTISATADVTATVISRCARCLEEVVQPIKAEMSAEFAHQPDPEDPDQYCFEASTLELTDAIRDALVLELPIRFLCKEDCEGWSEYAGEDMNMRSCHKELPSQHPFAALQQLLAEDSDQN